MITLHICMSAVEKYGMAVDKCSYKQAHTDRVPHSYKCWFETWACLVELYLPVEILTCRFKPCYLANWNYGGHPDTQWPSIRLLCLLSWKIFIQKYWTVFCFYIPANAFINRFNLKIAALTMWSSILWTYLLPHAPVIVAQCFLHVTRKLKHTHINKKCCELNIGIAEKAKETRSGMF